MTRPIRRTIRLALLTALAATIVAAHAGSAVAAPRLSVVANTNSTVEAGGQVVYHVQVRNAGVEAIEEPLELTATLPGGFTLLNAVGSLFGGFFNCSGSPGDTTATCSTAGFFSAFGSSELIKVTAAVDPGASGIHTAEFSLDTPALPAIETARAVSIAPTPPPFGIEGFDMQIAADSSGAHEAQAAAHPFEVVTSFDLNTAEDSQGFPGFSRAMKPPESVKNVEVDLPPGFLGNPTAAGICRIVDLVQTIGPESRPQCAAESQVGTIQVLHYGGPPEFGGLDLGVAVPVFNLDPPTGVAARFGFQAVGVSTVIDATVRNGDDYGVTAKVASISQAVDGIGNRLTLWGVPSAAEHDAERACEGEKPPEMGGPSCGSAPADAFLRNPTACTDPDVGLPFTIRADSWEDAGNFDSQTIRTHEAPGLPRPPSEWGPERGFEGCESVPFGPSISVRPTTTAADSPSGLEVDLGLPQNEEGKALSQSDLKKATVTLPAGMTVNPSSASGLGACSSTQIGLRGTDFPAPAPIRFTPEAPNCPEDSKIGTVSIETPALDHPINGAVYLAAQQDNPFGSLLAMYVVGVDPASGVVVKLPGRIEARDGGQLVTTFDNNPQLPFSELHLELFGGPRAALRTPPTCGTHTTQAELTPWARPGEAKQLSSSFNLTSGPGGTPCPNGGFDPKLQAGTANPLSAAFSPFSLRLTRADGTRELTAINATLPQGLLAKLAGVPYCPDAALAAVSGELGTGAAQIATPSCPAASQVGTVTVGAGAGSNPFYTASGRAYLAGPYKGAPLSLAVVTPAVAGPFDLGSVVVRNALHVDPATAKVTAVSDPFPTILHGIPLDLRDVRVELSRPEFTLNPTSCDPMAIDATIAGTGGASAQRSERFQVAGCDRLAFKPKLALRLKGATHRSGHPALRATLRMPAGNANIAKAQVTLPKTELLAQSHIRTICTRVQYAAEACPKGSVYGHARAWSPLLDAPLEGPVYLRSSSNKLPDLVAALKGQIEVDLIGRIDSVNARIRSTFDLVPDAPVTKFVLSMQGGKKSLLVNNTNICKAKPRATALFDGQNGKVKDLKPLVKAKCGKKAGKKR